MLRMTTTGDISKSEIKWKSLDGKKCLKVKMFLLQVFGDLRMTVNNKGSIHLYCLNTTILAFYEKLDIYLYINKYFYFACSTMHMF